MAQKQTVNDVNPELCERAPIDVGSDIVITTDDFDELRLRISEEAIIRYNNSSVVFKHDRWVEKHPLVIPVFQLWGSAGELPIVDAVPAGHSSRIGYATACIAALHTHNLSPEKLDVLEQFSYHSLRRACKSPAIRNKFGYFDDDKDFKLLNLRLERDSKLSRIIQWDGAGTWLPVSF